MYKVRPPVVVDRKGKGKAKAKASPDSEIKGHTDEVLSLAVSGDGKLLASAGKDRRVCVWDVEKGEWVKAFAGHLGHKDAVVVRIIIHLFHLPLIPPSLRMWHSGKGLTSCTLARLIVH